MVIKSKTVYQPSSQKLWDLFTTGVATQLSAPGPGKPLPSFSTAEKDIIDMHYRQLEYMVGLNPETLNDKDAVVPGSLKHNAIAGASRGISHLRVSLNYLSFGSLKR